MQNSTAIAASTAFPPFINIFLPISEHRPLSAAAVALIKMPVGEFDGGGHEGNPESKVVELRVVKACGVWFNCLLLSAVLTTK